MTTDHTPPADRDALRDRIAEAIWARYPDAMPSRTGLVMANPHALADAVLAVLPPPVSRADVLDRICEVVRRLAAHAVGFQDVLDESDRGPWGKTVAADIAELRRMINEDAPLSPFYEHPDCGFRWHGRDGMDIPMRDGQPVCPRCELRRMADEAQPGTEAARLPDCPSDCPCRRVCIGRDRQPAAGAQRDGARS